MLAYIHPSSSSSSSIAGARRPTATTSCGSLYAAARNGHTDTIRALLRSVNAVIASVKETARKPCPTASSLSASFAAFVARSKSGGSSSESKSGADASRRLVVHSNPWRGTLPLLHVAASRGHAGVVEALAKRLPEPKPWYNFLCGGWSRERGRSGIGGGARTRRAIRGDGGGNGSHGGDGVDGGDGGADGVGGDGGDGGGRRCLLSRLYSKDILHHIFTFLLKPCYVDLEERDVSTGQTARDCALSAGHDGVAALLGGLSAASRERAAAITATLARVARKTETAEKAEAAVGGCGGGRGEDSLYHKAGHT